MPISVLPVRVVVVGPFSSYAAVLRVPTARFALLLGLVIRVPLFAGTIVVTLHVVEHLGRGYAEAGVATAVLTVAAAISGPWRGRRLDRLGLRRTVLPSLVVLTLCWSVAPFLGYWAFLPVIFLAGLFVLPTFSIIRVLLIAAVPEERRKTALVLDSMAVEVSFMLGPALGVVAATTLGTPVALLLCELSSVLGGVVLAVVNPSMTGREPAVGSDPSGGVDLTGDPTAVGTGGPTATAPGWATPVVLALLIASVATTLVLTGTDVATIAALRAMTAPQSIGWILAVWGAGSFLGALVYGMVRRDVSAFVLLTLLGVTTVPVALTTDRFELVAVLFVAGLFCAPTITATVDHLSRVVPVRRRGEVLGWHGSAMTVGSAAGAPLVGVSIDLGGWPSGFVVAGVVAALVGALGVALSAGRRRRRLTSARSAGSEPERSRPG